MSKCTHQPNGESVAWLTCQIDSIVEYAAKPSTGLTVEELSHVVSSFKQAEMTVGRRFCQLLSVTSGDGKAA